MVRIKGFNNSNVKEEVLKASELLSIGVSWIKIQVMLANVHNKQKCIRLCLK